MHELGLARRLVEMAEEELVSRGIEAQVSAVVVNIGPLSGIAPASLVFYFDICKEEKERMRHATLVVQQPPLTGQCPQCGETKDVRAFDFHCPTCQTALDLDAAAGLLIECINVEQGV